ncbi:MAG: MlaD family protein [Paracoccus sp. (in: a-proteobacteria)]|nr:MlaD family protein [Paracoccus sp. (in: a-proteobacteria)]
MSDPDQAPRPASPVRRTAARAARAGSSLVWLVPIIALAVTLGLAWNAYQGRGQLISVEFRDATGITPGETALRFREIVVGRVEGVRFTEDLTSVLVDIRVDPDVAQYIDADAEFWIVRPIVSAQGISRLDTVLSGVFIEGFWDATIGASQTRFVGLERPALAKDAADGTWFVLSSERARGLSEGAPVIYRGLPVGRMQNLRLSPEDESILADIFIESPHDERLTSATAFWDTSGFSVSLGARGLSLNVDSLATLVQGGVSFATLASGGEPVAPGHMFRLLEDEDSARDSLMAPGEGDLRLAMLVDSSLRGLSVGADVDYQGLRVGRVTQIEVDVDRTRPEDQQVLQKITMAVSPHRLGLPGDADHEDAFAFIDERVAQGLRARVASAGFLGTSLMVELTDIDNAAPAEMDYLAQPHPLIPTAPATISDFAGSAEGFLDRIGGLNLEGLIGAATDMMNSVTNIAASDDTRAIPQALRRTIDEARETMTALRGATDELRESGAVGNAAAAIEQARLLTERLNTAVTALPGMLASAQRVTDSAGAIDFAAIGARATEALGDVRAILDQEGARALPDDLRRTLAGVEATFEDVRAISGQLREAEAGASLARMLDEAAAAAEAVRLAAADVPEMVGRMDSAAAAVETFDFAGISTGAGAALTAVRAILEQEDARALPEDMRRALTALEATFDDVRLISSQLREADAGGTLVRMLDEAADAAEAVRLAAADVPEMVERMDRAAEAIDEFDFASISAQADGILSDLREMLGSEDAAQLPRNLSDTLEAASGLLNDLRDGNAAGSLNAALRSARVAADEVASATRTLPELAASYRQLAARAEQAIASYGERGAVNTEARAMLREMSRAATAFSSLARAIERNPGSFLLGR